MGEYHSQREGSEVKEMTKDPHQYLGEEGVANQRPEAARTKRVQ